MKYIKKIIIIVDILYVIKKELVNRKFTNVVSINIIIFFLLVLTVFLWYFKNGNTYSFGI